MPNARQENLVVPERAFEELDEEERKVLALRELVVFFEELVFEELVQNLAVEAQNYMVVVFLLEGAELQGGDRLV